MLTVFMPNAFQVDYCSCHTGRRLPFGQIHTPMLSLHKLVGTTGLSPERPRRHVSTELPDVSSSDCCGAHQ